MTIAALIAQLRTYIPAPSSGTRSGDDPSEAAPSLNKYATLVAMLERIASSPVRNVATWAGNIEMVRRHGFASDLATAMCGVGAKVQYWDPTSGKPDLTTQDLCAYLTPAAPKPPPAHPGDAPAAPKPLLLAKLVLDVPAAPPTPSTASETAHYYDSVAPKAAQDAYAYFKVAVRPQNSHSLVNAFFGAQVTTAASSSSTASGGGSGGGGGGGGGGAKSPPHVDDAAPTLSGVRIVYGAIGANPVLAVNTMKLLEGSPLDGKNLQAAITALAAELSVTPEPAYSTADNPAGKAKARTAVLAPLLYKWCVRNGRARRWAELCCAVAELCHVVLPNQISVRALV